MVGGSDDNNGRHHATRIYAWACLLLALLCRQPLTMAADQQAKKEPAPAEVTAEGPWTLRYQFEDGETRRHETVRGNRNGLNESLESHDRRRGWRCARTFGR